MTTATTIEEHLAHVVFCENDDCERCAAARALVPMQCNYCDGVFPGTGRDNDSTWDGMGRWYCSTECCYPSEERREEVREGRVVSTMELPPEPVAFDDDGIELTCPDCGAAADGTESGGQAVWASFPCGNGREYNMGAVTYLDECSRTHWTDRVNVHDLDEPTVRCIIDTMRRTGATFAAHVLEMQYKHAQVTYEPTAEATRLREWADWLDAHPDAPTFYGLSGKYESDPLMIFCTDAAEMVERRRAVQGASWQKEVTNNYFQLSGKLGATHVQLFTHRDAVCERVVTGMETKLVADPDAPKIEKEVEIVEWICPDSLAEVAAKAKAAEPAPTPVYDDDSIPF